MVKALFPKVILSRWDREALACRKLYSEFVRKADLIFGIGCSFTRSSFAIDIPEDKTIVHGTLDPADINKDVEVTYALVGDADLILKALVESV